MQVGKDTILFCHELITKAGYFTVGGCVLMTVSFQVNSRQSTKRAAIEVLHDAKKEAPAEEHQLGRVSLRRERDGATPRGHPGPVTAYLGKS